MLYTSHSRLLCFETAIIAYPIELCALLAYV